MTNGEVSSGKLVKRCEVTLKYVAIRILEGVQDDEGCCVRGVFTLTKSKKSSIDVNSLQTGRSSKLFNFLYIRAACVNRFNKILLKAVQIFA